MSEANKMRITNAFVLDHAVCPEGQYGANCASTCTCNATNTDSCDAVSGNCTCKNGWEGKDCGTDNDECSQGSPCASVSNSTCTNTPGSYLCDCDVGFFAYNGLCSGECMGVRLLDR